MKSKTILLFIFFIFSTITADAQLMKWLNKQKNKIQKNEYVRKIQKSAKKIDPTYYITKKINEYSYTDKYVNNIKTTYNQINKTLDNEVNLYNEEESSILNDFVKTDFSSNELDILDKGSIKYEFVYPIDYNNSKFKLFKIDDFLFALSDTQIPIDNNLENIIKAGCWAGQIDEINSSYINNLKSFAKLNSELYSSLLLFYDGCISIFNKINNISYAGMTASKLIDSYSQDLGYNFSLSDTESNFNSYRNELEDMRNISNRINNDCNTFLDSKMNLNKSGKINYNDVQNSLNSFTSIANDINTLADQVEKQKGIISGTRRELSELSNFYGISFIESIGDLYKYLEDYYGVIEEGTRKHSNNFNEFVKNNNLSSSELYSISKSSFSKITDKQIDKDLKYINDYILILNDIQSSDLKNNPQNSYVRYLNNIKKLHADLLKSKEVDLLKFNTVKKELSQLYNSFPVSDAENYYNSLLSYIDDEQIIGGDYLETHSTIFKSNLISIGKDKSKLTKLLRSGKDLDSFYGNAKTNNTIFYVISIGIVVLIITIILIFRRKKKLKQVQPTSSYPMS